MIFTSLLPTAFIVFFTALSTVKAATVWELCAEGRHCIYGPPSDARNGEVYVVPSVGAVSQMASNRDGKGVWMLTKGAAGHFDVQCTHSPQPETWRFSFDEAGGTNTLRGGGTNSGVASTSFSGMSPVKKGNVQQAKGAGVDIFISCK